MLYFKINNNKIEKYQVIFDKEKIAKLKEKIITNCSLIEHKEYESVSNPNFNDDSIIKNFQRKTIGEKEYFEETKDIYHFSYDEYIPPYLVKLIDRLLKNDSKVIEEILNYQISEVSIDERINLANQEFMKIDAENIAEKKAKLKELENLLKLKELNKNQQPINLYYIQLIKLMNFKFIDEMSLDKINKVELFLERKLIKKNS